MSVVTLATVKAWLRSTHDEDDALLQSLIDGAEEEAKVYLGLATLPRTSAPCPSCEPVSGEPVSDMGPVSDSGDLSPMVKNGICALVQAAYDGGTADEVERMRQVAFGMLRPARCDWGV